MLTRKVEGAMDIIWENSPRRGIAGKYHVLFMALGYSGAIRQQKTIATEEQLKDFLLTEVLDPGMSPERRESRTDEWLTELHEKRLLSLRPLIISEELFDSLTVT